MEAHAYGGLQKQKRSRGARRAPGVMSLTSAVNAPAKGKAASAPAKGATGNVAPVAKRTPPDLGAVLKKASATAFRGGLAGFAAGIVQVGSFMWMRTVMNYQYANGGSLGNALSVLWKEGGIGRLYKGVGFAIIQNPLSRFGDTAANTGVLAVMAAFFPDSPVALQTALASVGGATWRIGLTPIDTFKTTLQVQGNAAFDLLKQKLYSGAVANFTANWVGNYPWFVTFNFLQRVVPKQTDSKKKMLRNAAIGIASSCVSDTVSNSLRVIKTVKQTNADASLGYVAVIKSVIAKDGLKGLFGRGLQTRLITNICQSMIFSVAWKAIEEELNKRADAKDAKDAKKAKAVACLTLSPAGMAGSRV